MHHTRITKKESGRANANNMNRDGSNMVDTGRRWLYLWHYWDVELTNQISTRNNRREDQGLREVMNFQGNT